jgi:Glucanosyltransferase
MGRVKGICYGNDAFPHPYNESNANSFQCTFSSDSTADYVVPLHGGNYANSVSLWCQAGTCRGDIGRMHSMGVELIRLYDWDPRNSHQSFLDHCQELGIGVLVSVSNYNLRPDQGLPHMNNAIPMLIQSFSQGSDYHPAVQGIVIGNEFNRAKEMSVANVASFTNAWASIEQQQFRGHRKVQIGHPVAFGVINNEYDCWYVWKQLIPQISAMNSRLFLAPQTYNPATDLFHNYQGTGRGYVDLTYDQFKLPLWFTEIGLDRTKPDHVNVVTAQLEGSINYSKQNPSKLIGCCMFQYADKVWAQGTTEGSVWNLYACWPGSHHGDLYAKGFYALGHGAQLQPRQAPAPGHVEYRYPREN